MVDLAPPAAPPGPVLFARYAYPPNRLGLCGPADAPALRGGAVEGDLAELRELARGFDGAYPYLQLIAGQAGVADPLDRRVVEAYWLGNDLSARVRPRALGRDLQTRFRGRMSRGDWGWLQLAVEGGSHPVHAFHVLEVFPRAGLMRGGEAPILETMDACRIRWGTVIGVETGTLVVMAARLELVDGKLQIGQPQPESVTAWQDPGDPLGKRLLGATVALHWGWACDRLTPRQLDGLLTWTARALALANQAI